MDGICGINYLFMHVLMCDFEIGTKFENIDCIRCRHAKLSEICCFNTKGLVEKNTGSTGCWTSLSTDKFNGCVSVVFNPIF